MTNRRHWLASPTLTRRVTTMLAPLVGATACGFRVGAARPRRMSRLAVRVRRTRRRREAGTVNCGGRTRRVASTGGQRVDTLRQRPGRVGREHGPGRRRGRRRASVAFARAEPESREIPPRDLQGRPRGRRQAGCRGRRSGDGRVSTTEALLRAKWARVRWRRDSGRARGDRPRARWRAAPPPAAAAAGRRQARRAPPKTSPSTAGVAAPSPAICSR